MHESITMATREQRLRDRYLTEQPWTEPRSERRRGRAGKPWISASFGRRILNGISHLVTTRSLARNRPAHSTAISESTGQ